VPGELRKVTVMAVTGLGRFQLCTPAQAGSALGAAVGLATWALVAFVPAFHSGLPQPVAAVLPFALAWAGHTIAAWAVPHKVTPAAAAQPGTYNSNTGTVHILPPEPPARPVP
jgi:hypothetical protein